MIPAIIIIATRTMISINCTDPSLLGICDSMRNYDPNLPWTVIVVTIVAVIAAARNTTTKHQSHRRRRWGMPIRRWIKSTPFMSTGSPFRRGGTFHSRPSANCNCRTFWNNRNPATKSDIIKKKLTNGRNN